METNQQVPPYVRLMEAMKFNLKQAEEGLALYRELEKKKGITECFEWNGEQHYKYAFEAECLRREIKALDANSDRAESWLKMIIEKKLRPLLMGDFRHNSTSAMANLTNVWKCEVAARYYEFYNGYWQDLQPQDN